MVFRVGKKLNAIQDRRLLAISIAALLVDFSAGVLRPVLPILAREFQASYALVGFVATAYAIARLIVDVPLGSVVDKLGRRPLLLGGAIIYIVGTIFGILATNIYYLIMFSFFRGLAYAAFFNACYTLVGDISPPDKRAQYMSLNLASSFVGISIGSAIGGEVTQRFGSQSPFILILSVLIVALIFTYLTVKESFDVQQAKPFELKKFFEFRNSAVMVIYLASFVSFFTANAVSEVFLPLYSKEIVTLSLVQVGLVLTLDSMSNLCTLTFFGQVSDKLGRKLALLVGFAIFATACGLLRFVGLGMFFAVVACFGISKGIVSPVLRAAVIDLADFEQRGLALGVQRIFCDLGAILGPVLLGVLSDTYGVPSVFIMCSIICGATCVVVYTMKSSKK